MSQHDKFGEHRPDSQPKDEWGNDLRKFDLKPMQVKRACDCKDHLVMSYSIEMEVPVGDNRTVMLTMLTGKDVETAKQWVPVASIMLCNN